MKKGHKTWIFVTLAVILVWLSALTFFVVKKHNSPPREVPVSSTGRLTGSGDEATAGASTEAPTTEAPSTTEAVISPDTTVISPPSATGYALWDETTAYTGGAEVLYEGSVFRARWWTQGEAPSPTKVGVWEYLGDLPASTSPDSSHPPAATTPAKGEEPIDMEGFKVVVYAPSWSEGGLAKIDFSVVTHVNYAFAIPTAEGGLRPLDNEEYAKKIIKAAHEKGAKVLIAVGGWSYNDTPLENTFMAATENQAKVESLGDAIVDMCLLYGFDGVDMDWEHPRKDGDSSKRYEALMLYLREKLDERGLLLTSAVLSGVTADFLVYYDSAAHTDKVLDAVDWINVMAYDGGDGERHSSYDFAVSSANYWKNDRKMEASKVVIGVPFYARPSWAAYSAILAQNPDAWKSDVSNYNGVEAHYNGIETMKKKTAFAKENLGGIMVWEISQDAAGDKSLLGAIKEALKN